MNYFTAKQLYPWLYSIYDPMGCCCYLVMGEKSAILFDTGYGMASLKDAVQQICGSLPLTVILGHGHIDHVNGAYQFDEAWIHPADYELCLRHTSRTAKRLAITRISGNRAEGFDEDGYILTGAGNLRKLTEGQIFDLGDLHVEVVNMEGHTAGSIGLLVQEHRVLLNSDAANPRTWLFLNESLPVDVYINMLERVMGMDFDVFFTGHSEKPRPKAELEKYIAVARNIDVEKATPYDRLPELCGLLYQEGDVAVVFKASG